MGEFELLVGLTARLASTARLDDLVEVIAHEIVALGFGAVWIAALDEESGKLVTLKDVIDGAPSPRPFAREIALDTRQPLGRAFRERRMINVTDPAQLHLVDQTAPPFGGAAARGQAPVGDRDAAAAPGDRLVLPRAVHSYLRGRPFACGPTLGSRGQPVGALVLSSYRGAQAIPEAVLAHGLLRVMIDQLGVAMERALHVARLERLDADLGRAQAAIVRDARLKALGELSLGVAHDLNHYAGIAMLAIGVGERSPADAAEVMPRIAQAVRAFRDLVARLQRAQRPPADELETADVARVVDDLATLLRPVLRNAAIELEVELAALPRVQADAVLVQQVVLNLVLNACDAMTGSPGSSGERTIRIRAGCDDLAVRLIVEDTGPGIPREVLDRLFQPYTTTKRDAHLGLGLATSRSALAQHGATIEARNAPAGGAVFEVVLRAAPTRPAEPTGSSEPAPGAAASVHPAPGPSIGRRARVLAVDDDPDVVNIIRAYLEPLGYDIGTATTSAKALAATASERFDLVLCDIGRPQHSGPEVCRLRREAGYRGKFVLMTGWDRQNLDPASCAGEWEAMLKKPFLGADLIQVLDAVLGS